MFLPTIQIVRKKTDEIPEVKTNKEMKFSYGLSFVKNNLRVSDYSWKNQPMRACHLNSTNERTEFIT